MPAAAFLGECMVNTRRTQGEVYDRWVLRHVDGADQCWKGGQSWRVGVEQDSLLALNTCGEWVIDLRFKESEVIRNEARERTNINIRSKK